jgi:hypothetical protein
MSARDDFSKPTRRRLAEDVGYRCSHPECRRQTIGPAASGSKPTNLGEAAHITAAAPGGARYDPALSSEERRAEANGVWMCALHAKQVDSDEKEYTVEKLRKWKAEAKAEALDALTSGRLVLPVGILAIDADLLDRLGLKDSDIEALTTRLKNAARADIDGFKALPGWPVHAVHLNLRRRGSGALAFAASGLANAIETIREATVIAPPGTGKSTTCVQLVDAVLDRESMVAVLIPLNEWRWGLLESVSHRRPYRGTREQDFQALAEHGRLGLVLDGWNELDPDSRRRAAAEIGRLQRELPFLRLVVSTRLQAVDVPLGGLALEIQSLSDEQQVEIARAIAGAQGEKLLDQVRRQSGLRELVGIPLFLTALLRAPRGEMPGTKEEVLRLFMEANEKSPRNAAALRDGLYGLHTEVLKGLAVDATASANTAISEVRSRSVVSHVEDRLKAAGQISEQPQPAAVLDLLVNHHLLVWIGEAAGVSFQHEQIQEWYGSLEVERRMVASAGGDTAARRQLRNDILNEPAWEESILFACERASRADDAHQTAVAGAIVLALEIDPMLAAEMIYRSKDTVWKRVREHTVAFGRDWHRSGVVDRAVRFMITSGREEFASDIWPLISNTDQQVALRALRIARRFRPSVLGAGAEPLIVSLSEEQRGLILAEIASESGFDGMELATLVAKSDPSPRVRVEVIEALQRRRANRHVAELLADASDEVWQSLAAKNYPTELADPRLAERLRAERERQITADSSPARRLQRLLESGKPAEAIGPEIADLIASPDFPAIDQAGHRIIHRAFERFSSAVTAGLLRRLGAGLQIPFHGEELLVSVDAVDNGPVAAVALDLAANGFAGQAAASVVGPATIGALVDALATAATEACRLVGPDATAARERCQQLKGRITAARPSSLAGAVLARADSEVPETVGMLADLLAQQGGFDVRRKPFLLDGDLKLALVAASMG